MKEWFHEKTVKELNNCIKGGIKMYDWILKYGDKQQHEMRSGYSFPSEELAKKNGEKFIESTNHSSFGVEHYPNARIEVIEI